MTDAAIRQLAEKYACKPFNENFEKTGKWDDACEWTLVEAMREACAQERAEVVEACAKVANSTAADPVVVGTIVARIRALATPEKAP